MSPSSRFCDPRQSAQKCELCELTWRRRRRWDWAFRAFFVRLFDQSGAGEERAGFEAVWSRAFQPGFNHDSYSYDSYDWPEPSPSPVPSPLALPLEHLELP